MVSSAFNLEQEEARITDIETGEVIPELTLEDRLQDIPSRVRRALMGLPLALRRQLANLPTAVQIRLINLPPTTQLFIIKMLSQLGKRQLEGQRAQTNALVPAGGIQPERQHAQSATLPPDLLDFLLGRSDQLPAWLLNLHGVQAPQTAAPHFPLMLEPAPLGIPQLLTLPPPTLPPVPLITSSLTGYMAPAERMTHAINAHGRRPPHRSLADIMELASYFPHMDEGELLLLLQLGRQRSIKNLRYLSTAKPESVSLQSLVSLVESFPSLSIRSILQFTQLPQALDTEILVLGE